MQCIALTKASTCAHVFLLVMQAVEQTICQSVPIQRIGETCTLASHVLLLPPAYPQASGYIDFPSLVGRHNEGTESAKR
jgi:hypothetical protein